MSQNVEPTNLVNANIGLTNIIEKNEIRSTMVKTFIELADKLKAHCGPYSGTAILTNPDDPLSEPIFTKDGINIVRSMQYAAPIQDFVRRQLAYMGSRIERSAGDGTTSTMILMAYTLASLLDYCSSTTHIYSTNDIATTWQKLVNDVMKYYDQMAEECKKITDKDTIRYIAASQAYTSSHGDKELAECIGKLFSNTPKDVWNTLSVNKAIYESEDKYQVEITDSEYSVEKCRLFPNDRCNEDLGTVLHLNGANCLILDVLAMGDDTQKAMFEYLDAVIRSGKQLIVLCSDNMDAATRQHFDQMFVDNSGHNTVFVLVPQNDSLLNDLNAVMTIRYAVDKERVYGDPNVALKGKEDLTDEDIIKLVEPCLPLFNADIYFKGDKFRFTKGLLPEHDDSGISPLYNNPEYATFNEYVKYVRIIIEREKSDVSRVNNRLVQSFIRILHKLITTRDVTFTVGGAAYDNAATQDVAMDALLATKSSLTKGFVAGRCVTLKHVLNRLVDDHTQPYNRTMSAKANDLYDAFIKALLSGIDEVDKALEDSVGVSDNILKALQYKDAPVDFTRLDDPSYEIPMSVKDALEARKDYCILEPIQTDITFIKRFGEIGLKFLTANRVITAGYLFKSKNGD